MHDETVKYISSLFQSLQNWIWSTPSHLCNRYRGRFPRG